MVRAADADEPLRQARARLPWPASQTAPLDPAVRRILAGIGGRSAHVYAQRWIRGLQWLPRAALPTVVGRLGPGEIARLDSALRSTAGQRRHPLGPGGRAAFVPDQASSARRAD
jgi:hypothetical protein